MKRTKSNELLDDFLRDFELPSEEEEAEYEDELTMYYDYGFEAAWVEHGKWHNCNYSLSKHKNE